MKLLKCVICSGEVKTENTGNIAQKTECNECGHVSGGNKETEVLVIRKKQIDES
jgi:hypothetical protein